MKYFLFILILLCAADASAQKVVLRNGIHRAKLKPGKDIGVTLKGEQFHYANWKSVCSGCFVPACMDSLNNLSKQNDTASYSTDPCVDTVCIDHIWTLDSVTDNYLVLRQTIEHDSAYRFDTVAYADWPRYERKLKHETWFIKAWVPPAGGTYGQGYYIVAIAEEFLIRRVPIDSIASFTFPKADNCATFGFPVVLFSAACIIGAPIAAAQDGPFNWTVFAVGEAVGALLVWAMYDNIQDLRVKTYNTSEWKVKPR